MGSCQVLAGVTTWQSEKMANTRSSIEWTDTTWNPTTGCDRVSPGCDNCYALTLAKRLKAMGNGRYQNDGSPRTSGSGFGLTLHHDILEAPLTWRRPRRVFVNSMSDLFHDDVPDEFIAKVFSVMARTPRHQYQILTKRPRRMRNLLGKWSVQADDQWQPAPNIWLGTSVEDQKRAALRIPLLLDTPAAVRFVSCEPLLGQVDLADYISRGTSRLHWVIVGGESGAHFRPLDPVWARLLRDQCLASGVAFFFKQVGGRTPKAGGRLLDGKMWNQMPAQLSSPAA